MIRRTALLALTLCLSSAAAQGRIPADQAGGLFDRVVTVLERGFYDKEFRKQKLPALVQRYRPAALAADIRSEERAVVHAFLGQIPASHLAVYSRRTFDGLMDELKNVSRPSFGCELTQRGARFFVCSVREGGAAMRAGLKAGDRVLTLDGAAPHLHPRLDWRSDDAWLDDPPLFALLSEREGDAIKVQVESKPGHVRSIELVSMEDSGLQAAERSVKVFVQDGSDQDGRKVGYLHFWFIHVNGCSQLMRRVLRDDFADCDAVILDLRGRGGSASEVTAILKVLEKELGDRQLIALQDGLSRSAKEVMSYEIKKRGLGIVVGERSAGAVLPASFRRVTRNAVLMYPAFTIGAHSTAIEGIGVEPDVAVERARTYAAGVDPILEAALALKRS